MATSIERVTYQVVNKAKLTPGGIRFMNEIGEKFTKKAMDSATLFTWWLFQQKAWHATKQVENVKMTIVDEISNLPCEVRGNEIYVSAKYIETFPHNRDLKTDFTGLIYHSMGHVWQWDGKGQAPYGLRTGIADYVRMRANLRNADWAKIGYGDTWDQGFTVTANFLNHCRKQKFNFIVDLNEKLANGYSPEFFKDITNMPVDSLWKDYKSKHEYS